MDAETSFKSRWEKYADGRRLSEDPTERMPPQTVAEARREALEFFSWGIVHENETRRRLEQLQLGNRPRRRPAV